MNDAAPLFGLAALVSSVALLVHVSLGAWLRWRDSERTQRLPDADTARLIAALQDQVGRVERALELQGLDLERVAEGQRFAARLLAERGGDGPDGRSAVPGTTRVITPH